MNLVLDTHAFLWFIKGDEKLSGRARELIEARSHTKYVSAGSVWEIAIKTSLGRLSVEDPFDQFIENQMASNGFILLPLNFKHLAHVSKLPFHHRDPFDRLIAAQCIAEGFSLVSIDAAFDAYAIQRLW